MAARSGILERIDHLWHLILKEAAKFGVVGAVAFVVDYLTYVYLLWGPIGPQNGPLHGHYKISSALATTLATLVSWVGNRYWTFRHKRNEERGRELLLFAGFNAVGLLITMGCVVVAVDVFGLRDLGGQTVARVIGIVLGTLFRFWTYRTFVFRTELDEEFGSAQPAQPEQPAQTGSARVGLGQEQGEQDRLPLDQLEPAPVALGKVAGQPQAESGALGADRAFEDVRGNGGGDTRSLITHLDHDRRP